MVVDEWCVVLRKWAIFDSIEKLFLDSKFVHLELQPVLVQLMHVDERFSTASSVICPSVNEWERRNGRTAGKETKCMFLFFASV